MNRLAAFLAGAACGAVATYLALRAGARPIKGSLGIEASLSNTLVTGYIAAVVEKGTPPITIYVYGEAIDENTGREVWRDTKQCTGAKPGDRCVLSFGFYAEEGHTYQIRARAIFRNRYGEDTEAATKTVGPIGTAPKGTLSIIISTPTTSPYAPKPMGRVY